MKNLIVIIVGLLLLVLLMYFATTKFDNAPAQKRPNSSVTDTTEAESETQSEAESAPESNLTGSIFEFSVTNGSGATIKSTDLVGKPILLHFWASWHEMNVNELPALQATYEKYGDEVEFIIVCITDGEYETVASAQKYLADKGYTFPIYFDTMSEALHKYQLYKFEHAPRTYLYTAQGQYVTKANITLNEEMLEDGIEMILPQNNSEE